MISALLSGMTPSRTPSYRVDSRWQIVEANDEFCTLLKSTRAAIIGRDVLDLVHPNWRPDFRCHIARAMTDVADLEATVRMVTPRASDAWVRHRIEPIMSDGRITGYAASLFAKATPDHRPPWWKWRPCAVHDVWDFEIDLGASVG